MLQRCLWKGGVAVLLGMLFMAGCTPKITQEQLQRLRELRAQERQLTQDIQRKESEKGRFQREISARQTEFQQCDSKRRFVQEKLAVWPNVWPDYTPPSPSDTTAPGVGIQIQKKRK